MTPSPQGIPAVADLLKKRGLCVAGEYFPKHWAEPPGYYVGVYEGRIWVQREIGDEAMWFDTIEEADAWVLACWRMK